MKNESIGSVMLLAVVMAALSGPARADGGEGTPATLRESQLPEMVRIPAGSFDMGSPSPDASGTPGEQPLHRVTISRAFELGKYEVTQGLWHAVMGYQPTYYFNSCGYDCPVNGVTWDDAQRFIRKLNQMTGRQYRLPTEAEWEYACRAGAQQAYCGSDSVDAVAWYAGNSGFKPHPVGRKQANAFGLYDMSGNVWEWVEDKWKSEHDIRVMRGGSWFNGERGVRAAARDANGPDTLLKYYGFRLARTLP